MRFTFCYISLPSSATTDSAALNAYKSNKIYYFVKRTQIGSSKYIKTVKNIRVKVLVFYNIIPTFLFGSRIFIALGRDVIQLYKL